MVVKRRMSGWRVSSSRLITATSWAEVTCPDAVSPVGLTKWVSSMPRPRARLFICSTNSSVTPETFSARATAASLPEETQTHLRSSSTVMRSPSDKNT